MGQDRYRLPGIRVQGQLSGQADAVANAIKSQIVPRYYLSEKIKGCAKAKNVVWQKDANAAKLFNKLATAVAGKKLAIEQTVTIINPLAIVTMTNPTVGFGIRLIGKWFDPLHRPAEEGLIFNVTFKTQIQIEVEVYNARLQQ